MSPFWNHFGCFWETFQSFFGTVLGLFGQRFGTFLEALFVAEVKHECVAGDNGALHIGALPTQ